MNTATDLAWHIVCDLRESNASDDEIREEMDDFIEDLRAALEAALRNRQ